MKITDVIDMLFIPRTPYSYTFIEPPEYVIKFYKDYHDVRGCYRYDFKVNNHGHINKTKKTRG